MKTSLIAVAMVVALGGGAQAAGCAMPANGAEMKAEASTHLNSYRSQKGRKALGRNAKLDAAAQAHACWMARTGEFGHLENGTGPKARVKSRGYCTRLVAENIALGQGSGNRVMADWMGSEKHYKNIMLGKIREFGVGVAMMGGKPAWVMVFAKPC